jgi:Fe2+ or Zn2+ uptake regulation protein
MTKGNLEREVESRLLATRVRYTSGRRRLVDELARAEGPMSAAELHAGLHGRVPLSSIYRSLAVLEEAGVLVPHLGQKGLTRYELAEWLRGHHHHLVCLECGSVDDVELPASHEASVAALVREIGSAAGFEPAGHALEIEGRCARCA